MASQTQNAGLARLTAALAALNWWMQWGTGSGKATSANAVTTTSTTEARASATASQQTVSATNDTLRLTGTITAAGSRAITEYGAFDAAGSGSPPTGGNMCYYADFAVINLSTGDTLTPTLNVTYS